VSQVNITKTETELKQHFNNCKQIPNTGENHYYIPLNSNTMRVFRVSGSSIFFDSCVSRQFTLCTHIAYIDIALHNYVACTDGGKWWFGVVTEKSDNHNDCLVKFIHPEGQSLSFH
jgi:hypothetical protein